MNNQLTIKVPFNTTNTFFKACVNLCKESWKNTSGEELKITNLNEQMTINIKEESKSCHVIEIESKQMNATLIFNPIKCCLTPFIISK